MWRDTTKEELRGCFLATNWDVFYQDDSIAEVITGYIHFCVDTVVPKKTIKVHPNYKEYITPEINQYIRRRNQAFKKII